MLFYIFIPIAISTLLLLQISSRLKRISEILERNSKQPSS